MLWSSWLHVNKAERCIVNKIDFGRNYEVIAKVAPEKKELSEAVTGGGDREKSAHQPHSHWGPERVSQSIKGSG